MMIKKTYLTILSVVIVAVLLGSLFYSNVTFAPKPTQPTQVEVINFPTEPSWKVISVVENFNLTWVPDLSNNWVHSDEIDLGPVNVSGYNRAHLYMRVTNFTELYQGSPNQARVILGYYSTYEYGEIMRGGESIYWYWDTTQSLFLDTQRTTTAPFIRITFQGASNTPNGPVLPSISCLVSIGIYLRNE